MKRLVVAGVTGRVGSAAASALLAERAEVIGIVRDERRGAPWARRGAAIATGSLDDEPFLIRTLDGAGGFFVLLPENVRRRASGRLMRPGRAANRRRRRQAAQDTVGPSSTPRRNASPSTSPAARPHTASARQVLL